MNRSCNLCKSNLGGGCCKANSERECMDDDERPLFTPRTLFKSYVEAANYRDLLQPENYRAVVGTGGVVQVSYE